MVNVWYFTILNALYNSPCLGQDSIDVSKEHTGFPMTIPGETPVGHAKLDNRRYWLVSAIDEKPVNNEDDADKDENLKVKISTLVEQTIYDTEQKINTMKSLKEQHREQAPYKAGFILSLIKKSKDVLNELFNVAIRHKSDWKALEQLKVFELIVHTNVDTTNLVRQLVEIHIQHMNATSTGENRKRVVLLK